MALLSLQAEETQHGLQDILQLLQIHNWEHHDWLHKSLADARTLIHPSLWCQSEIHCRCSDVDLCPLRDWASALSLSFSFALSLALHFVHVFFTHIFISFHVFFFCLSCLNDFLSLNLLGCIDSLLSGHHSAKKATLWSLWKSSQILPGISFFKVPSPQHHRANVVYSWHLASDEKYPRHKRLLSKNLLNPDEQQVHQIKQQKNVINVF